MTTKTSSNRASFVGQSVSLIETLDHVSRAAPLNKPVLIIGERGTGKELIADRLHFLSGRWEHPLIKLNCASMNENLLESELFGHEAGAFTGANRTHRGRFERAHGGTLFLDELATSSLRVQEKLLRVIEYGEFERLGGHQQIQTDARLVAATNRDLQEMADDGLFRADLLDRLAFDVIHLPPLRYRKDDIQLLAEHFAIGMIHELGREYFPGFSNHALNQLLDYHWPGNVRELKNAVERSIYRSVDEQSAIEEIIIFPLAPPWPGPDNRSPLPNKADTTTSSHAGTATKADAIDTSEFTNNPRNPNCYKTQVREFETSMLLEALEQNHYNQRLTAKNLNLSYHQLRGLLRKYQIAAK